MSEKQALLTQPKDAGYISKVGRLEVLNGHGALTGKLWAPDGTRWTCHFGKEHLELLPDAWMHTVELSGRAIVEEGKEPILEVDSIEIADGGMSRPDSESQAVPFWTSIPLPELIERQGVSPVKNLDQIAALWPADDDPDELLEYPLTERAERRKLSQQREEN